MRKKDLLCTIKQINEMTKNLETLSHIRDADTTLADIVCEADLEQTGIFEELSEIYEKTEDIQAFESLFKLFTGYSFEEFLLECIIVIRTNFCDENGVDKGHEILSEAEFEGLSKIAKANKLDWFAITQFEDKDYIVNLEEGEVVLFEDGLEWLSESIYEEHPDYEKDYNMTQKERDAVVNLFKEYDISEDL